MSAWVWLALVILAAVVILAPSAEPAQRAERLIRAWRRNARDSTTGTDRDSASYDEKDDVSDSIEKSDY